MATSHATEYSEDGLPIYRMPDREQYIPRKGESVEAYIERKAAETTNAAALVPTFEDPFLGLEHLAKVGVFGRERIRREAERKIVFAWDGIVERGIGQIVGLVGKPGDGKSELLFMISTARLHRGRPVSVLGRVVTPAPDGMFGVFVQAEHGLGSISTKLLRSSDMIGASDDALDRMIIIARKNVTIGDPVWLDVVKLIQAGLVADVFIDSLARVARSDSNDEQAQAIVFDEIHRIIEASPAAEKPIVWIVAHTKKREGDVSIYDMSGSQQRIAQLDVGIVVNARHDVGGKVLASKVTFERLREGDADAWPEPVEFTLKRNDGRFVCELGGARSKEKDGRPLEERITDLLSAGAKTKNALRTELNRNDVDIELAIDNLFSVRRITTTTITVRGRSFKAFALRDAKDGKSTPDSTPDSTSTPYVTGRAPDSRPSRRNSDV